MVAVCEHAAYGAEDYYGEDGYDDAGLVLADIEGEAVRYRISYHVHALNAENKGFMFAIGD